MRFKILGAPDGDSSTSPNTTNNVKPREGQPVQLKIDIGSTYYRSDEASYYREY